MAVDSKQRVREYKYLVKKNAPPKPILWSAILAFLVGGAICTLGQGVLAFFLARGLPMNEAVPPTTATMIFLGALLTGLGVYDEIGRVGGMGAAIPVTGFANSIVSPAMEFKREGFVLGLGARMFQVAGPVIVYGLVTSFLVGLVQFLVKKP